MPYKPNFCCECGEKIERVDWNLLTSRHFCEICDKAFVVHEKMPIIIAVCGILVGLTGFVSYLRTPETPNIAPSQFVSQGKQTNNRNEATRINQTDSNIQARIQPQNTNSAPQTVNNFVQNTQNTAVKKPVTVPETPQETVYFCGAATKKGTPCSRRVKGGGRCWQHEGQAAMLPQEKLIISNK